MDDFLKELYTNIGKKIKGLAKIIFIISSVCCILYGIMLIAEDIDLVPLGTVYTLVGPIASWIASWLLYAFGEFVDKTVNIEHHITKLEKLKTLRAQGIISEEEYHQAVLSDSGES